MTQFKVVFEGGIKETVDASTLSNAIVKAKDLANDNLENNKILTITDEMGRVYTDIILTVHYKLQINDLQKRNA